MAQTNNLLTVEDVPRLRQDSRASLATDRFNQRRDLLVEQGRNRPVERLASFLLFLSRDNVHSGGDGHSIAGDLQCGFVAELLKFTVSELEEHLLTLQRKGLILPCADGGLQLADIAALERVSNID